MGRQAYFKEYPLRGVVVRPTDYEDCIVMAPWMRRADKDECKAATGATPFEALRLGYNISNPCQTMVHNATPCAIFGVAPAHSSPPRVGFVWLLGTDDITKNPKTFLRLSKEWLELIGENFDILTNWVDARNTVHIRWLKWMGFQFINQDESFGAEGRRFYEFVRIMHV